MNGPFVCPFCGKTYLALKDHAGDCEKLRAYVKALATDGMLNEPA